MPTSYRITIYSAEATAEAKQISTPQRVAIAHEIAAQAQAIAPVKTGRFRAGISVTESGDTVEVVDNDETAGYKEYGTSHTPAHATLTSTASEFGRYSGIKPRGGGISSGRKAVAAAKLPSTARRRTNRRGSVR